MTAKNKNISLPKDASVDVTTIIGKVEGGLGIRCGIKVVAEGLDREILKDVVKGAHLICPYSKATKGNIEVEFEVNGVAI